MNIVKAFNKKEIELLNSIDIKIDNKEYTANGLKDLSDFVYKNGYMNFKLTYSEADKYKYLSEKIKIIKNIEIEKVSRYTKQEYEEDESFETILVHDMMYSNPKRISKALKNQNKDMLKNEEYNEKYNRAIEKYEHYIEYMKEKYGQDLNAVNQYYMYTLDE